MNKKNLRFHGQVIPKASQLFSKQLIRNLKDAKNDGVHIAGRGSIVFTKRFPCESEKKLRRTREMEKGGMGKGETLFYSRNLIRREKMGRARLNGSMRKRGVFEVGRRRHKAATRDPRVHQAAFW